MENTPKMLINMHFGGVFHLDNLLVDFWEIICYSMKYIDNKKTNPLRENNKQKGGGNLC